jgi:protein involved in polysaccharide export with SLBB domain
MSARTGLYKTVLLSLVLLAPLGVAITGCASHANLPVLEVGRNNAGVDRVYRLEAGDKLTIRVFSETELSGKYEVAANGYVPFPLIGNVEARGLTLGQFRRRLAQRLANGYLKRPRITVDITSYRPIYVHGEVRNGGKHEFKAGLKVQDVVAMAGGYTYRADESFIILNRVGRPGAVRVVLPSNLNVLPGDNIRIPERFF